MLNIFASANLFMKPITLTIPNYPASEYLLVLNPHEALSRQIKNIKENFTKRYQASYAYGRPHITLARFMTLSRTEEKIVRALQNIAHTITPFSVQLNDYGSFPANTIFINVAT